MRDSVLRDKSLLKLTHLVNGRAGLRQKHDNQQANKKVPGHYFQFSDDYLPPAFFPDQSNVLNPWCGTCIYLD